MDEPHIDRTVQGESCGNFRTHGLVFPTSDIAKVAPLGVIQLTNLLMFLTVLVAPAAGALVISKLLVDVPPNIATGIVVSLLITSVILIIAKYPQYQRMLRNNPLVFDRGSGLMLRENGPDPVFEDSAPLSDITALQICSEPVETGDPPYTIWELNVVMSRPALGRVWVMAHGDRPGLYEDAQRLAEFLGVPVLDHTG